MNGTKTEIRHILRSADWVPLVGLWAWAAFLFWLWLGGDWVRFVGPRTAWVVPAGAIILTLCALLNEAASIKTDRADLRPPPLERRGRQGVLTLAVLLAPIVALALVPDAGLGSLSVSRKGSNALPDPASLAAFSEQGSSGGSSSGGSQQAGFLETAASTQSTLHARELGLDVGSEVQVEGFVSGKQGSPDSGLTLGRFAIACCAADAVAYTVDIDTEGIPAAAKKFPEDTWVRAEGTLQQPEPGGGLSFQATEMRRIEAPEDPFIETIPTGSHGG